MTNLSAYVASRIAAAVRPELRDPQVMRPLGRVVLDHGEGNIGYELDQLAEEVLMRSLAELDFAGTVFSEESGLTVLGDADRLVICDPYCNSNITFRGFRESAAAVHEATRNGEFRSGAVADMQIARLVAVAGASEDSPSALLPDDHPDAVVAPSSPSSVDRLDEAFVVVSALKATRRRHAPAALMSAAGFLTTISGSIIALRLVTGEVDAFVDNHVGQPAYEVLPYRLLAEVGGVVTTPDGGPIDFAAIAREISRGDVRRYPMVATSNPALHEQVLASLR